MESHSIYLPGKYHFSPSDSSVDPINVTLLFLLHHALQHLLESGIYFSDALYPTRCNNMQHTWKLSASVCLVISH